MKLAQLQLDAGVSGAAMIERLILGGTQRPSVGVPPRGEVRLDVTFDDGNKSTRTHPVSDAVPVVYAEHIGVAVNSAPDVEQLKAEFPEASRVSTPPASPKPMSEMEIDDRWTPEEQEKMGPKKPLAVNKIKPRAEVPPPSAMLLPKDKWRKR
jgi:hypothetical protein